jgi:crotonobetainyl-CoA:carnitine CoA-transferase CaiB-like acyl-CoA transferase
MAGPLDGVLVVDLTRALAGPHAGMMLGDLGARVIKVEPPAGDDTRSWGPPFVGPEDGRESTYFLSANRNKESVTLDLKAADDKAVLLDLVRRADVLVENFRTGVLDRLGLGFEGLQELNPRLVLVSISGYGKDGPAASQTAFCNVALAASGYLDVSGEPFSQVHHTGVSIADRLAGVHGAVGAVAALVGRAATGKGQHVDVSLLDAALSMIEFPLATFLTTGRRPPSDAEGRRAGSSPNHIFHARDGLILINAPKQDQWVRLLRLMGREDLESDPRFDSPLKRQEGEARVAIEELVGAWLGTLTAAEAHRLLVEADVPAAPVRNIDQVAEDAQLRHRRMIVAVENPLSGAEMYVTGNPVKLAGVADEIGRPAAKGEHNAEIYSQWLGYSDDRIRELAAERII